MKWIQPKWLNKRKASEIVVVHYISTGWIMSVFHKLFQFFFLFTAHTIPKEFCIFVFLISCLLPSIECNAIEVKRMNEILRNRNFQMNLFKCEYSNMGAQNCNKWKLWILIEIHFFFYLGILIFVYLFRIYAVNVNCF